jgi:hypothetical protein
MRQIDIFLSPVSYPPVIKKHRPHIRYVSGVALILHLNKSIHLADGFYVLS